MYVVIRKFNRMRSVAEAARRAESGLGQLLKQLPGFQGYYVFDAGDGVGGSVTLFESQEAAVAANEQALAWTRGSLIDVIDGEPEITMGPELGYDIDNQVRRGLLIVAQQSTAGEGSCGRGLPFRVCSNPSRPATEVVS
jgi:hypothetical protein